MLEIIATPPKKDDVLFNVEFGLKETTQTRSAGEGEITTILGKKNILYVSDPVVSNQLELSRKDGTKIPAEIELMIDEYNFYHIRFVCTFKPDEGCKFVWARLGLMLSHEDGETIKSAIAYDMFPKDVFNEVKVKRSFKIAEVMKFSFNEIQAGSDNEQEFIKYEPEIISYGLLQSNPCWDFTKSRAKDFIIGDRELFLIIKAPKDMNQIEAKFIFSAEVQSFLEIFQMIPVNIYKDKSAVEGSFMIKGDT